MNLTFKSTLVGISLIICIIISIVIFKTIKIYNYKDEVKQSPIIIGFVQLGSESAWRNANSESIKSAAKNANVCLIFKNAEGSQPLQKKMIEDFILQQVDVIIFPPLVNTGWDDILIEAKKAGIPVIISDRTIKTKKPNLYSAFVGADFAAEGEKAAKWLVQNTKPNEKINIVELKGLAGSSPAVDRAKGFRKIISIHQNITIIDSATGDFIKVRGKLEMKKLLKKHGRNINVVFAHNDDMALGAIEAIEEYGLKPGKDILIVSVDGERALLQAIKDGKANVSIECTPLIGPVLIKTAEKLVNGEKIPLKTIMEEKVFTRKNIDKEIGLRTY